MEVSAVSFPLILAVQAKLDIADLFMRGSRT
jgi:hypothetical protein